MVITVLSHLSSWSKKGLFVVWEKCKLMYRLACAQLLQWNATATVWCMCISCIVLVCALAWGLHGEASSSFNCARVFSCIRVIVNVHHGHVSCEASKMTYYGNPMPCGWDFFHFSIQRTFSSIVMLSNKLSEFYVMFPVFIYWLYLLSMTMLCAKL